LLYKCIAVGEEKSYELLAVLKAEPALQKSKWPKEKRFNSG
jgi:hypothetical protein